MYGMTAPSQISVCEYRTGTSTTTTTTIKKKKRRTFLHVDPLASPVVAAKSCGQRGLENQAQLLAELLSEVARQSLVPAPNRLALRGRLALITLRYEPPNECSQTSHLLHVGTIRAPLGDVLLQLFAHPLQILQRELLQHGALFLRFLFLNEP